MSLTLQQEQFVEAFVATMNQAEAARIAGYGAPTVAGSRLAATVHVRQAIQARLERARAQEGLLRPEEILRRLQAAAFVDPGELSSIQISCCRHCHGPDHAFQWRSEQEWAEACERELAQHEHRMKSWRRRDPEGEQEPPRLTLPSSAGGFDFDAKLLPIADCPKCDGRGKPETIFADTRMLSPAARLLYAGVKQTKDGLEIKLHDQLKMRELLMRHHGMLNDKLITITPGGAGALGVEQDELAELSAEDLEAIENVQTKVIAMRERKATLAAPDRPAVAGEITDA